MLWECVFVAKYPFFLKILMTFELFDRLLKNSQILNLVKVHPVEG